VDFQDIAFEVSLKGLRTAGSYNFPFIDDDDVVGEAIGFFEILGC